SWRRKVLPVVPVDPTMTAPTRLNTGRTGATMPPLPPPVTMLGAAAPRGDGPAGPVASTETAERRSRWPWIAAAALIVLALAGGLVLALGRSGGDSTDAAESGAAAAPVTEAGTATTTETTTGPTEAAEPSTTSSPSTTMSSTTTSTTTLAPIEVPDVEGLSIAEAEEALTDADLVAAVVEEESPGPYDEVVSADPAEGAEVSGGDTVTLTVNKPPAQMPDVLGQDVGAATRLLESYEIEVAEPTEVLDETQTDGAVTDQTPKPGEPFAASAQLTVSRQPEIVYLADLEAVDSNAGYEAGQAQVNGDIYTRSVYMDVSTSTPLFIEYDLARKLTRLRGVIGVRDDSTASSLVKVEIFADGTPVSEQDLALGQIAELDLDMTNVLRLRLQVTNLTYEGCCDEYNFVFADVRLIGVPGVVPTTTTGP
ncbi:MAG: PASTA domain-containing protein, partial [Ilumatobacteraceae bacterium]